MNHQLKILKLFTLQSFILLVVILSFSLVSAASFPASTKFTPAESYLPAQIKASQAITFTPVTTIYIPSILNRENNAGTPVPTATQSPSQNIKIVEVKAVPEGDNPLEEYVAIQNMGRSPVNLKDWTVGDKANNTYTFSEFTLQPQAMVKVWTITGTNNAENLYWGRGNGVWNNEGDTATLRDSAGTIIDQYTYPVVTPTVAPTATPTKDPNAPNVEIIDILYNPPDAANREYVEIRNNDQNAVVMTGWLLSDKADNTFTFPEFTLQPQALVKVWTITGTNNAENLYWGRSSGVWNNNGDTATLRDANKTFIDLYSYPTGTATPQPTTSPTPLPTKDPNALAVKITNIVYDPPDAANREYVEIQNQTENAVNLTNWTLSDAARTTFTFPEFTLASQASVKVWVITGTNDAENLYWGRNTTVWNNDGDTAILKNETGLVVDVYTYPTATPTPAPGTPTPVPTVDPNGAKVRIITIEYNPDGNDLAGEFVDIKNFGENNVNMTAWILSDKATQFKFPEFTLAAQATVRVWVKEGTNSATELFWGNSRALWNNGGDTATLKDSAGAVVDTCSYEGGGTTATCE